MSGLIRSRLKARICEEQLSIRLGERLVPYILRRSERRSLALRVDHRGLRVAVPWGADLNAVGEFIRAHGEWVLERLASEQVRGARQVFVVRDGAEIPVLGEVCRVRLEGKGRSARWRLAPDGVEELVVATSSEPRLALIKALRHRALPWFAERVAEYCFRLGKVVPPVRLSSARTRWGSCSTRSGIRLNWRLIHLPPPLIDYVVAHEVAHLVEMNHSPRFWAVVGELYPAWCEARTVLRDAGLRMPLLDDAGMARNEMFED